MCGLLGFHEAAVHMLNRGPIRLCAIVHFPSWNDDLLAVEVAASARIGRQPTATAHSRIRRRVRKKTPFEELSKMAELKSRSMSLGRGIDLDLQVRPSTDALSRSLAS